jgi:hypothetical protein
MTGRPVDFLVVVDEDAVMQYGDISGLFEPSGFEDGGEEDNIEGLPLAGPAAGVYFRRSLAVNRGRLAIWIELLGV